MWGIGGHRLYLAHVRRWPLRGLLSGGSSGSCSGVHQRGQRWSTLNERVQSFLYARAVEIDIWSSDGGSVRRCDRHSSGWGAKALRCSWRAWHGLARRVLDERWAEVAVGLRLLGGDRPSGSCCYSAAAVEQTEDFSLQLLLMVGVGGSAWGSWQAQMAGLHREVGRVGWSRKSGSCGRNVGMSCCRCRNVDCSCDIRREKKKIYFLF